MPDVLLTTDQVAKRWKKSRRWVQSVIKRKKLPAQMIGNTYVVRLKDVQRYKHQAPGHPAKNGHKKKRRGNGHG